MTSCFAWLYACTPCGEQANIRAMIMRAQHRRRLNDVAALAQLETEHRAQQGTPAPTFDFNQAQTLPVNSALAYEHLDNFAQAYRASDGKLPYFFSCSGYQAVIVPSLPQLLDRPDKWTTIRRINPDGSPAGADTPYGWKLRASIAHGHFPLAWDIIKDKFIEHQLHEIKFYNTIVPEDKGDITATQATGKEIVLFAVAEPITKSWEQWQTILQDIAVSLAKVGVHPGPLDEGSHLIRGSYYFSYRNDAAQEGGYIAGLFNASQARDDFQNIKIDIPDEYQLDESVVPESVREAERVLAATRRGWCCF